MVRRVALRQLMGLDGSELLERAEELRYAPPVPEAWRATDAGTALAEQADLAMALAPLRVEFDERQWADLGRRLDRGEEPDAAAEAVRQRA